MRPALLIGLCILTLISFAPVLGVVLSSTVADTIGCPLDEGSAHRCMIAGANLGDALYAAFVLGWFAVVTWPGMLVSLALWAWVALRYLRERPSA